MMINRRPNDLLLVIILLKIIKTLLISRNLVIITKTVLLEVDKTVSVNHLDN